MSSWKVRDLAVEAVRNTTGRRFFDFLVASLILAAVGFYTATAAMSAVAREQELRRSGSLVWTAVAADDRPIAAADCARLSANPGVVAAGGFRSDTVPQISIGPAGRSLAAVYVLPDSFRVWQEYGAAPVTLGSELVQEFRAATSSPLYESRTQAPIDAAIATSRATLPVSILRSRVAVQSAPHGTLGECWARFDPGSYSQGRAAMAAALHDDSPLITPFVESGSITSPSALWQADMSRQPAAVALLLLISMQFVGLIARRTELAIYLAFNTRRRHLALMTLFEQIILIVPAMTTAVAATAVFLYSKDDSFEALDLLGIASTQIGASAIAAMGASLIPLLALPKRRAFAWLKDR